MSANPALPRPRRHVLAALSAPQLSSAERERRDVLILLLTVALVAAPHFPHLSRWADLAFVALWSWRLWLTVAKRRLPGRLPLTLLLAAAIVAVGAEFRTLAGRDAGVTLLLLLLALKLLELRARRDIFVVIFLALFILMTQFLFDQGLPIAALTLLSVLALTTVMISVNLTDGDLAGMQKLRIAGALALKALPLALILFVFFPRLSQPLWGLPRDAFARSGLSDSMTPGSISRLLLSDGIAFRVRFQGTPPPAPARYWRGPVFDAFDGRTWKASPRMGRLGALPLQIDLASAVDYTITLEPHQRRWLFALDLPLTAPAGAEVAAHFDREGLLSADAPVMQRTRYALRSYVRYVFAQTEPPAMLRNFTRLPAGFNPRTLQWAAKLRERNPRDADLLAAVLDHFRHGGFAYTLEPPLLGRNSVDEFLFDTKLGYCEHYAGALAVVMRAAGIPARVVTGYQGGEINPVDGFMTLHQADAHAWAEVWLGGRGWVRVDPTAAVAPVRIDEGIAELARRAGIELGFAAPALDAPAFAQWLAQARFRWDALQNSWNQWVLSYSSERQLALLDRLGFEPNWHSLGALLATFFVATLAALGWQSLRAPDPRAPAARLYDEFRNRLTRAGLPVGFNLGPRGLRDRLAADASARLTDASLGEAQRLLQEFERLRYSPVAARASRSQLLPLRRAVRSFRPALA